MGPLGAQKMPDTRPKCVVTMIKTQSDQSVTVGIKSEPFGPSKYLWDPQKGLSGPKLAHLGALGAQKRPDTRPKCVVTMILTQSDQSAAVGTKSGPSGPSESLWGPQKGLSGPNEPFWGPGVPKRSVKGPKCMIWMRTTQIHCVEVFWMPVGPSRLSPGIREGQKGPWAKNFNFVTVKNFQWDCVPIFFSVHY